MPLRILTLHPLCGLLPQAEDTRENESLGNANWQRKQWQLIEHHENVNARVMDLRITLLATLDDGVEKVERMVQNILDGAEPSEEK